MNTNPNSQILRAARTRIEDRGHFVMGTVMMAWDRNGCDCDPLSPDAWRWTPRGAIYAESGIRPLVFKEISRDHTVYKLLNSAAREMPHERPGAWGLGHHAHECRCLHQVDENLIHSDALKAFDRAIALAEADEAPIS